ncbi:hypothetical protein SAY87_018276 [Trapa incisa]|uniref:Uncharacterized protein n=1 Tax=Trapa incisa TaxID=236973 RepID=A0AAN7L551_9MYRT|nr:hypothetical protein SAY87_018276 [Trapa incisa]
MSFSYAVSFLHTLSHPAALLCYKSAPPTRGKKTLILYLIRRSSSSYIRSLMAAEHKFVIVPLLFLLMLASSISARLLIDGSGAAPVLPALTKPALHLSLPGDGSTSANSLGRKPYSDIYFRQMFLNALPKGSVTPSGPSRGTNDVRS